MIRDHLPRNGFTHEDWLRLIFPPAYLRHQGCLSVVASLLIHGMGRPELERMRREREKGRLR